MRVRLTRIEELNLNLFDFDCDLTMMIFFLDPTGKKVYARYGQRNADNADSLQSLEGLRYTMESVVAMHRSREPIFAPLAGTKAKYVSDVSFRKKGCFHCHNVREAFDHDLKKKGLWSLDRAWRFPLPETVGIGLEVNRGNIVEKIHAESPAEKAGIRPGDRLHLVGSNPIHSIADVQFALEHTPKKAELALQWQHGDEMKHGKLALEDGWKRSPIHWRPSLQSLVPSLSLSGNDISAEERSKFGLSAKQLAFRQRSPVGTKAEDLGFRAGDIILGIEGRRLENMNDVDFYYWLRKQYVIGEDVRFVLVRDGAKRTLNVKMR